MSTQVQFRRGNTAQTSTFTGAVAEITVDTDKETIVVHDGSTAGGFPLARESALSSNLAFTQAAFNLANTANIKIDSGYAFANITGGSSGQYFYQWYNLEDTKFGAYTFIKCWENMGWTPNDKILLYYFHGSNSIKFIKDS